MFNRIRKPYFILIGIFSIFTIISYTNNRIKLTQEKNLFTPPGNMVEVNGANIHVYSEGQGNKTLIFMSGGGTCSPLLDFKSLYSKLSSDYKTVVVEKSGYGFSDITSSSRDIDTILHETREALIKANIKGPYILVPHSMSGIEAIYWAQKYPTEVEGIIGLDMAVPEAYLNYKINMPFIKIGALANKLGFLRFIPTISNSDAIKHGTLTSEEKELYKTIFHHKTATKNMINEAIEIKNNSLKVSSNSYPNIPTLIFSSNGIGTGYNEHTWRQFHNSYIKNIDNAHLVNLDCSHYIHNIEYNKIAEHIKTFITTI